MSATSLGCTVVNVHYSTVASRSSRYREYNVLLLAQQLVYEYAAEVVKEYTLANNVQHRFSSASKKLHTRPLPRDGFVGSCACPESDSNN